MSIQVSLYFSQDRNKALLVLVLLGLVYVPFIGSPLVFDDVIFFHNSISAFSDAAFELTLRWFSYTTYGVTWVFAGENPPVYRLQNLLLHGMNVLLLLLLLRVWINLFVHDDSKEKLMRWGAWLAALLFACHPLAVYSVGYLVQRSILMATLFSLVMQLAYLRAILENKKKYLALAVVAYFLAVFSKEHSVMAPAILLPLTWLLRERIQFSWHTLLLTWIGFALVGLLVMLSVKGVIGVAYEKDATSMLGQDELQQGAYLLSVMTQAGLFFKYCGLMLLPNPAWMSVDMRETFITSYADSRGWLGLLAFIIYGVFALRCLWRGGRTALLGLALLYPWLLFMTEFSTVRVQEIFVLYRSYLWMPGIMLLPPLLLSKLPEKKNILAGALAVVLLIPLSWNRLWVFADDYRLWDEAVQLLHGETPLGAQRIYYNRAQAAGKQKNWDAAIADLQKCLQIGPQRPQIQVALADKYFGAKRYHDALLILDEAIAKDPKNMYAYYYKGMALQELKDEAGAKESLQKSCDLGGIMACVVSRVRESKDSSARH